MAMSGCRAPRFPGSYRAWPPTRSRSRSNARSVQVTRPGIVAVARWLSSDRPVPDGPRVGRGGLVVLDEFGRVVSDHGEDARFVGRWNRDVPDPVARRRGSGADGDRGDLDAGPGLVAAVEDQAHAAEQCPESLCVGARHRDARQGLVLAWCQQEKLTIVGVVVADDGDHPAVGQRDLEEVAEARDPAVPYVHLVGGLGHVVVSSGWVGWVSRSRARR